MDQENKNKIDQTEEPVKGSKNSRRQFIQKASAASLIVAIPGKSAWATNGRIGAAVSGNLSGNLSTASTSNQFEISGLSPKQWSERLHARLNSRQISNSNRFRSSGIPTWGDIFGVSRSPLRSKGNSRTSIIQWLPKGDNDLGGLFANEKINQHLIAAFLNAEDSRYGFVEPTQAQAFVQSRYDELSGPSSERALIRAIEETYTAIG